MMQPIAIQDSSISYHKTATTLTISIPGAPHFKQLWAIVNQDVRAQTPKEDQFGESLLGVIMTFVSMYLMPFTVIQQIILNPVLSEMLFKILMSICFIYYLTRFTYFINGSTQLELTPKTLRLYRKVHLLGYGIKVKAIDIRQVQVQPWKRLRHSENMPRVLCSTSQSGEPITWDGQ
jgi:hypothetical protein